MQLSNEALLQTERQTAFALKTSPSTILFWHADSGASDRGTERPPERDRRPAFEGNNVK